MVAGRLLRGHHILVKGGIYVKKNKKMIVGFLAPAVIIFLIVFLYPIIRTIMMSMYKIESVTDTMEWWTFVGLGNYQKLFTTAIVRSCPLPCPGHRLNCFFLFFQINLTHCLYAPQINHGNRINSICHQKCPLYNTFCLCIILSQINLMC